MRKSSGIRDCRFDLVSSLSLPELHNDAHSFKKDIIQAEYELKIPNSALANSYGVIELDALDASIETGKYNIIVDDVVFETFFNRASSDNLVIFLPGANDPFNRDAVFNRWSWGSGAMSISFADPMTTSHGLSLGWFLGTPEKDYRELGARIVYKIASLFKIKNENVMFYGSSMGGTVALFMSSFLPGSRAVSINPQINLVTFNHYAVNGVMEKTGFDVSAPQAACRTDIPLLIRSNDINRFFLFFNILSEIDMEQLHSLTGFCDNLHFGVNIRDNVCIWLYKAASTTNGVGWTYHNAQDCISVFAIIKGIVYGWEFFQKADPTLFIAINELWADRFELYHQVLLKDCLMGANDKDGKSMCLLSDAYFRGMSMKPDESRALELLIESAIAGYGPAIEKLRRMISNPDIVIYRCLYFIQRHAIIHEIDALHKDWHVFMIRSLSITQIFMKLQEMWSNLDNSVRNIILHYSIDNRVTFGTSFKGILFADSDILDAECASTVGKAIELNLVPGCNLSESLLMFRLAFAKGFTGASHDIIRILWKMDTPEADLELLQLTSDYRTDAYLSLYRGRMLNAGRGVKKCLFSAIDCISYAYNHGIRHISYEYCAMMNADPKHSYDQQMLNVISEGIGTDSDLNYWMGRLLYEGRVVERDEIRASYYFDRAEKMGSDHVSSYRKLISGGKG